MHQENAGLSEFDVIERFFASLGARREDVALGVGDDAALLRPPPGHALVTTVDTLVDGVHFPPGTAPEAIGHRALAVSLSDVAAMGASPAWATLALTVPEVESRWLEAFARGFAALAERFDVALVGGDTTRGPLTISVHVHGFVAAGNALTRSGARPGDGLYVTGSPGDAAAGLALARSERIAGDDERFLVQCFYYPEPRVEAGRSLVGLASAAIDVSDGLAGDAAKLAQASGVHIALDLDALPLSAALTGLHEPGEARTLALEGGDDYELLFTVPEARGAKLDELTAAWDCACSRIGSVASGTGVSGHLGGREIALKINGYRHF